MRKEYHKYLLSREWAQVKIDLYSARGRKCERCGSSKKLEVHHKTYKNIFKEEPKDLEILCQKCHSAHHKKKLQPKKQNPVKKKKLITNRRDRKLQKRYNQLRAKGMIL